MDVLRSLSRRGLLTRSPGKRDGSYEPAAPAAVPAPVTGGAGTAARQDPARRDPFPRGKQQRVQALLALLDDGQDHHVADLASALGLSRLVVTRYLTELIEHGHVVATAPPRDRRRRYRRA